MQAVSEGYAGYDLPFFGTALPVYEARYRDHIALGETIVYPAAKRQKLALRDGSSGQPVQL